LVEVLITLLASLTIILSSLENGLPIPEIDIATVTNSLASIANMMDFINNDHPEFALQYRELIDG